MPGRLTRGPLSVRIRLTLFVALTSLPLLAVALVFVVRDQRAALAAARLLAATERDAVAARLEAALLRLDRALSDAVPAAVPGAPDPAAPAVCARRAVQAPGRLAALDGRGRVLCAVPPGDEAAWSGAVAGVLPALVRRARSGGSSGGGQSADDPSGGAPVAAVVPEVPALLLARPADMGGEGAAGLAAVTLLVDGAELAALTAPAAPASVPAVLRDGEGRALRLGAGGGASGPGVAALPFGLALSPAGGAEAAVLARVGAEWERRLAALGAGLVAALLAASLGAGPALLGPLSRLSQAVGRWRAGGPFRPAGVDTMPRELRDLSRSFGEATGALDRREAELREAISRQGLLMQEIHHRVKNNLQIIASLLNLQASRIRQPQARAEFQSARDRVRALATLHRHLYAHEELHTINMRLFLTELCGQLFQAMGETEGKRIALSIAAPELQVSSDQAVPLALIVTEAVSNAVKYAFPHGRRGHIWIHLAVEGDTAVLEVRDDGVGIAAGREETEAGTRDGLGLTLIRGFARQLGAALTVEEGRGTRYVVRLPLRRERPEEAGAGSASGPDTGPAAAPVSGAASGATAAPGATATAAR